MTATRKLGKLLNDFSDLEQDNYFLIKEKIALGLRFKFHPVLNLMTSTFPLQGDVISIISRVLVSVVEPTLFDCRGSFGIFLLEDETMEFNVFLSNGQSLGLRHINFQEIKHKLYLNENVKIPDQFFNQMVKDLDCEITLKIKSFSPHRKLWEEGNYFHDSRAYRQFLIQEVYWQEHIKHMIESGDLGSWAKERLELWQIYELPKDLSLIVDLMDIDKIPINRIVDFRFFLNNFFSLKVRNQDLLHPPLDYYNLSKIYLPLIGVSDE